MNLIEKTKLEAANTFHYQMRAITQASDTIADLENLSAEMHKNGFPNQPLVCAHDHGTISIWMTLYLHHEENVISMLNYLKQLHYAPEVIASEHNTNHGYSIGDIKLTLDNQVFPEASLTAMHRIVFGQSDDQTDAGNATIPAFLLKDNEAKTESEVPA